MKLEERGNESLIHCFGTVGSCMDTAYELIAEGRFPVWDSVQAVMQTAGRGRMRRGWSSLAGNVFAAVRLPDSPPFNSSAAAVAIGALCASALRSMGCPVFLKWPNDIVIRGDDQIRKAGGILVEDRPEGIIAGIGLNLAAAPDHSELDRKNSIAPGVLDFGEAALPDKWELWRALLRHIRSIYKNETAFETIWRNLADELLLWRGLKVKAEEEGWSSSGQLIGVGADGAALLRAPDGTEEITRGSLSLEDSGA